MSNARTITNEMVPNSNIRKIILKFIISTLILIFLAYLYLISSITFNVVARKSLDSTAHDLSSKVGTLEVSYLTLSNTIDQSKALSLGFVDSHNNIIVTREDNRVAVR